MDSPGIVLQFIICFMLKYTAIYLDLRYAGIRKWFHVLIWTPRSNYNSPKVL